MIFWKKKQQISKCVKWILVDKIKNKIIEEPHSYMTVRYKLRQITSEADKIEWHKSKHYNFNDYNYEGYVVRVDGILLELVPFSEWIS